MTFQELVQADQDLVTSAFLEDEEIVAEVQRVEEDDFNEAESDQKSPPPVVPFSKEADSALNRLRHYLPGIFEVADYESVSFSNFPFRSLCGWR